MYNQVHVLEYVLACMKSLLVTFVLPLQHPYNCSSEQDDVFHVLENFIACLKYCAAEIRKANFTGTYNIIESEWAISELKIHINSMRY